MDVKTWKDLKIRDIQDSFSFTAILDDRGRIVIPASIRKKLRIKFGSSIMAKIDQATQHTTKEVDESGK